MHVNFMFHIAEKAYSSAAGCVLLLSYNSMHYNKKKILGCGEVNVNSVGKMDAVFFYKYLWHFMVFHSLILQISLCDLGKCLDVIYRPPQVRSNTLSISFLKVCCCDFP